MTTSQLKSVIPPKACFTRSMRFADSQHSFAVKLEKCRTTSFANRFVPMTSRNWNSLPASIFPSTYNLQTFKTWVHNTYASTPSLEQLSLLIGNARIFRDTYGLHHSGVPLLAFDFIKKKKYTYIYIYIFYVFLLISYHQLWCILCVA